MNTKTSLNPNSTSMRSLALVLSAASLILAGCAGTHGSLGPGPTQGVPSGTAQGTVYGGQSPISGASIRLYAAGTTGYASTNTNVLTTTVTTNAIGQFTFGSNYTCTAGQQMYLVAVGGNTGSGTNANAVTVAAIGDCSTINASTFINMNEVTTVAAAYAFAPFAASYTNIGTSATNVNGLKRAFVNAAKLANSSTGTASGTLPSGATAPTSEINTLADILSACVNTTGGVATDTSTNCGKLFSYTTSGAAPTDTFGAALNIARNPATNVANLFALVPATPPFASPLGAAPNDWSVSIVYTGGNFNGPKSTTIDANGQVWVANSTNNTVSVLAQNGTPIGASPLSGNSLGTPSAIAIDNSGNAWVTDNGTGKVSAFTNTGGVFGSSPFTVGTGPVAIAFDAAGNAWVANNTGNSITELSATGTSLQTITSGVTAPTAIAIDPK